MKIEIEDVEIDLRKIGIDFDLNSEQIAALKHLGAFVKNKGSLSTVLSGSAGSGKSSLVKILMEFIKLSGMETILAAPTHKAKSVLNRLSDTARTTTLHKLLELKPNVTIEDYDVRDLLFVETGGNAFLASWEVLIIDECSMINNVIYDLIINRMNGLGHVIFVGDPNQLKPVKQTMLAKVFDQTDYPGVTLHRVERQGEDSPLLDTLVRLREKHLLTFKTMETSESGIITYKDKGDFARQIRDNLTLKSIKEDPFNAKILCYTNARVDTYNIITRRLLKIEESDIFTRGELLTANDTYTVQQEPVLHNGTDYVVLEAIKKSKDIPFFGNFPGYELYLFDTVEQKETAVFLLDPNASAHIYGKLAIAIESVRLNAIDKFTSGYHRKIYWRTYYAMLESFVTPKDMFYYDRAIRKKTLGYGYASTVHKSQGSTYNNVLVDMGDILKAERQDTELLRQLQYVGLSRARNFAHLLL